jgi:predicted RNA-binding protein with PIN domain
MRFLIDGYNLMHRLGLARPRALGQLERCRDNLLDWLTCNHQARSDSVAVVFDGSETISRSRDDYTDRGIRIRFSVGRIADDLIEEIIDTDRDPRRLTVVSSDRRIQESARRRGCEFWSCDRYLEWSADQGHSPPKPPRLPDKPESLTPEEAELWKREFADLDEDPELRDFNKPFKDFLDQ